MDLTRLLKIPALALGLAFIAAIPALWLNRPLSKDDQRAYANEIDYHYKIAALNRDTMEKIMNLGLPDGATKYGAVASRHLSMVSCLLDLRGKRTEFQKAKATCNAATGSET